MTKRSRKFEPFSQPALCGAILKYLAKCDGCDLLNVRQMNAVVAGANLIADEIAKPHRPAVPNSGVAAWLQSDETGRSSLYMAWALGATASKPRHDDSCRPHDPSDFGRCVGLLDAQPSLRTLLHKLSAPEHGREWNALISVWDELEALYREELLTGKAPKLYARMQEVLGG